MGVITFSSLKGGVGKTSLSINVAHAFAHRGCRTLLIDLDPAAHATGVLSFSANGRGFPRESRLAKLFLSHETNKNKSSDGIIAEEDFEIVVSLREDLDFIPGGSDLRYFLWGPGPKSFARLFPQLIDELKYEYDYIIFDTQPDFNVLTRNAIAASDMVTVPVDASGMSISSLEELLVNGRHINGPLWTICRTMVNRQATRVQSMSNERLAKNVAIIAEDNEDDVAADNDTFLKHLNSIEVAQNEDGQNEKPIYLLRSLIARTEQQNKLTFTGNTAFDHKGTKKLSDQYLAVARELEMLMSLTNKSDAEEMQQEILQNVG